MSIKSLVKMKQTHLNEVIINKKKDMYTIRGKITNIEDQQINTDKGDFLKKLVTIEEVTDFKNQYQFEIFGEEKINVIEHSKKLSQGQIVDIDFYIKSREYKGRFYNSLMVKDVRVKEGKIIENIISENPPF
jgi:hypothetical protein